MISNQNELNEPQVYTDERNRLNAIIAAQALCSIFRDATEFISDPVGRISWAKKQFLILARNKITPPRPFSAIARHRAEISLLLSVQPCLNLRLHLNEVCMAAVAHDTDHQSLISGQITETGVMVVSYAAHIENCLHVLNGIDKTLNNPNGPNFPALTRSFS